MATATLSAQQAVTLHALTEAEYSDLVELSRRLPDLITDEGGRFYRASLVSAVRLIRSGRAATIQAPRDQRRTGLGFGAR